MRRANVRRVAPPVRDPVDVDPIDEYGDLARIAQNQDTYPSDWRKGALLNVRDYGIEYIVTLYPEEFDAERPERSLHFTNLGKCQDFVSKWYAAEHHDPRAR